MRSGEEDKPGESGTVQKPPSKSELIDQLQRAASKRKEKYVAETGTSRPAGADPSDGIQPPDTNAGRGF